MSERLKPPQIEPKEPVTLEALEQVIFIPEEVKRATVADLLAFKKEQQGVEQVLDL